MAKSGMSRTSAITMPHAAGPDPGCAFLRDRQRSWGITVILAVLLGTMPAGAQEAGWHYSPLPGEGDRAALGCASGSDARDYACIAVRCEDDFSVGFHVYSSRPEGDAGAWIIDIDAEQRAFAAGETDAPYGARLTGDLAWLRDRLEQGAVAYLQPQAGAPLHAGIIPLSGSLHAITLALAYCAPRLPAGEPKPGPDVDPRTNKEN